MLKYKKNIVKLLIILIICTLLFGCAPQNSNEDNTGNSVTFTDAFGSAVTVKNPRRVISLMGSYTEAWKLAGGNVIATTSDAVQERGLDLGENVEIIGTVKEPNLEKIIRLDPDLVLLSADLAPHISAAKTLQKAGITCAFFKVDLFEDYLNMMSIMTDITGRKDLYEKNALEIKSQIDTILGKANEQKKPTVLLLRAFSSGVKSKGEDNMVGAMLKDLNTVNIVSLQPSLLENLNIEEIVFADPEYIFITTMGSDTQKAIDVVNESLLSNEAMQNVKAIKNNHYYVLDKEHFQYKPNLRWAESYEILYNYLYENQ
jgi:iron complex transport system substrate-binding protein